MAATYRDLFAADMNVRDTVGHGFGVRDWSAHQREAIELGVRASLLGVLASDNMTVLEIDFTNPDE